MTESEFSGSREIPVERPKSHSDPRLIEIEREVARVFAEILELEWASPEDDIFGLGGDSFEAVRIALELEHRFDIELPVEILETINRVGDLAAWINAQLRVPRASMKEAECE
jgi:acyl carrier protein